MSINVQVSSWRSNNFFRFCNQSFRDCCVLKKSKIQEILKKKITTRANTVNFIIFFLFFIDTSFIQWRVYCRYNFSVLLISCHIITSTCTLFPIPSTIFNDYKIFLCQTRLSFSYFCSVVIDILGQTDS